MVGRFFISDVLISSDIVECAPSNIDVNVPKDFKSDDQVVNV